MALSKCPKCNNGFFEVKLVEPRGSRYKQNFVQCSSCGAPIGVVGFFDTGAQLEEQGQEITKLQKQVAQVVDALETVNENIRRLARR
jgi:hypothetical protein